MLMRILYETRTSEISWEAESIRFGNDSRQSLPDASVCPVRHAGITYADARRIGTLSGSQPPLSFLR
jgi:hypothetical protein